MTAPLIIKFPVFGDYAVSVEVAPHIEKAMERYRDTFHIEGYEEDCTNALTVHHPEEGMSYVFLRPRASPGTVAHEAWHVLVHMWEGLGIELDHESMAYHLGYLVDKIDRYVKGRKK